MRENVSSGPGQQQDGEERTDFVMGPRPSGTAAARPCRGTRAPRQSLPRRAGPGGSGGIVTAERCPAPGGGQKGFAVWGGGAEPRAALGKGHPRGQRGDPGNGRHGAFGASEGRDVPHGPRSPSCVYYGKWERS